MVDAHPRSMARMRTRQRILYVISAACDFSLFLVVFTVSRGLAESGADLTRMGIAGGGLALTMAASSYVTGRLTDSWGHGRIIAAGSILLTVSATGCAAVSAAHPLFYGVYWLAGLAGGMVYPPVIAWLSQGHRGDQATRSVGSVLIRFCVAWNVGMICGQLSGGFLFGFGRLLPLALAGALPVLSLVLLARIRRGPTEATAADETLTSQRQDHQTRSALFAHMNWVSNLGGAFSISMIFHLFPDLAVALGVAPERHGTMLAMMRSVTVVTYLLMHNTRFWHHRFSAVLIAQAIALAGLLTLVLADTALGLTLGLIGLGVFGGYNYFASIYYSTTGSGDRGKGRASGMHEATLALGIAGGSLAGGVAGDALGPRAPYALAMCMIACMLAVQTAIFMRARGGRGR